MSTIDNAYSSASFGSLSRALIDSASLRMRVDNLNAQASSGRVSDTYAGMGAGAAVSLDLRPQLLNVEGWQANIDAVAARMDVTRSAMDRIQEIASNLRDQVTGLNGLNPDSVDTIAANARTSLQEVASLLNSQVAGVYVFAGQDTANPPVPDADQILSSGFYTQIATSVAALGTNGATATAADTLAIAASNTSGTSPFSVSLSQSVAALDRPKVEVGPRHHIQTGLLASGNVLVPSTGASTTGSYMRDLMRALATVGSLSGGQASDPGFADLVADTRTSVTDAVTAMAGEAGVFGDAQATLTAVRARVSDAEIALTRQISGAEDVDMADTLSRLSLLQTQLQASYQLIVGLNGLSLTKFLSGA